jgi:hypothetical protein
MDSLFGLLGYVGVGLLLLSYFLLVVGQMKVTDTHYIFMNVIGALLVVITLHTGGAVPIFYTIVGWLLISLFGFYKHHMATTTTH